MGDSWQKSIALIRSSNAAHITFGTGFPIHCEGQATYIVTCAHVVDDILDEIREKGSTSDVITVSDADAIPIASGFRDDGGIDMAVLRVEKLLNWLPLRRTADEEGKSFRTAGFQQPLLSGRNFTFRCQYRC